MKNILVLLSFLVGVGFLIAWLWSDNSNNKTLKQHVNEAEISSKKDNLIKKKENKKEEKVSVRPINKLGDVEILDDDGLIIETLYGQKISQRITNNPVKDIQAYDGVLTFSEKDGDHWNFKAINLEQYIQQYLKK